MPHSPFLLLAAGLCASALGTEFRVEVPGLGELLGTDKGPAPPGIPSPPKYDGIAGFYGVPYAKPPVGALRFQPPQPHGPWQGLRNASVCGHACMGPDEFDTDEDCLVLNLATPQAALGSARRLPVMFFIHGGGYRSNCACHSQIDELVSTSNFSVVVVATNYRLGTFGFLGGSQIQARTTDGSSGNFGIQDQRLAMAWVRDHIGAFGGDGTEVTIFGESAGANAVINHLAQPASFPLYKRAIIESGTCSRGAQNMSAAQEAYGRVLLGTGCRDLDCLVALDASVLEKYGLISPEPVVDGVCLTDTPWSLVLNGKHKKNANVIVGSNRDEMASFLSPDDLPNNLSELEFDALALPLMGSYDAVQRIKQLYDSANYPYPVDLGNYSHWWWAFMRMTTDAVPGFGACAVRSFARALLQGGTKEVHTYLFANPLRDLTHGVFAFHSLELPLVFGSVKALTRDTRELAEAMVAYWTTFARTGEPMATGQPSWPLYDPVSDTNMRFQDSPRLGGVHPQQALRKDACDYWDTRAGDIAKQLVRWGEATARERGPFPWPPHKPVLV